jgi:hypothetical protein
MEDIKDALALGIYEQAKDDPFWAASSLRNTDGKIAIAVHCAITARLINEVELLSKRLRAQGVDIKELIAKAEARIKEEVAKSQRVAS